MRNLKLLLCGACLVVASAATRAQPDVASQLVAFGFDKPTSVRAVPGLPQTYVVAEQSGLFRMVVAGQILPEPYLDITGETYISGLAGLQGFVFHPDYATNGWLYTNYTTAGDIVVIRRYQRSATNPFTADPSSGLDLVTPVTAVGGVHPGGGFGFGPDGMLYAAIGDQRLLPGSPCTAQLGDTLLGKLLRLGADGSIPPDNPFVGDPTFRDEIFAYGFRNPFRLHFDADTGDLYIADVGENDAEEVNLIPAGAPGGANFGWRLMEGEACTGLSQCVSLPCPPPGHVAPILSYSHAHDAVCVIGGAVARGSGLPGLEGHYVYADWRGPLWSLRWDGAAVVETHDLTAALEPGAGLTIDTVVDVAAGEAGEILVVDPGKGPANQGELYRIVPRQELFVEVGPALPGGVLPQLEVHGSLQPSSWLVLEASMGSASPACFWVLGLSLLGVPFKGGVLGPAPDVTFPTELTSGVSQLVTHWPAGLPSGAAFYVQVWISDPAGPAGLAASPTLQGTIP